MTVDTVSCLWGKEYDVTLVLVIETVVLDVTEEVEELPLESAPLAVLAAVTAVDGVEVETAVVTVVDDSLGEAEVVEVLALDIPLASNMAIFFSNTFFSA